MNSKISIKKADKILSKGNAADICEFVINHQKSDFRKGSWCSLGREIFRTVVAAMVIKRDTFGDRFTFGDIAKQLTHGEVIRLGIDGSLPEKIRLDLAWFLEQVMNYHAINSDVAAQFGPEITNYDIVIDPAIKALNALNTTYSPSALESYNNKKPGCVNHLMAEYLLKNGNSLEILDFIKRNAQPGLWVRDKHSQTSLWGQMAIKNALGALVYQRDRWGIDITFEAILGELSLKGVLASYREKELPISIHYNIGHYIGSLSGITRKTKEDLENMIVIASKEAADRHADYIQHALIAIEDIQKRYLKSKQDNNGLLRRAFLWIDMERSYRKTLRETALR